jgi:mycofactocin precursor
MPETSETERLDAAEVPRGADRTAGGQPAQVPTVVVEDLAIEDVSIDGMCGVY